MQYADLISTELSLTMRMYLHVKSDTFIALPTWTNSLLVEQVRCGFGNKIVCLPSIHLQSIDDLNILADTVVRHTSIYSSFRGESEQWFGFDLVISSRYRAVRYLKKVHSNHPHSAYFLQTQDPGKVGEFPRHLVILLTLITLFMMDLKQASSQTFRYKACLFHVSENADEIETDRTRQVVGVGEKIVKGYKLPKMPPSRFCPIKG